MLGGPFLLCIGPDVLTLGLDSVSERSWFSSLIWLEGRSSI